MPAQVATGVLKAWAVRAGDLAELAVEVVAVVSVAEAVAVVAAAEAVAVAVAEVAAVVAGSEVRTSGFASRVGFRSCQ